MFLIITLLDLSILTMKLYTYLRINIWHIGTCLVTNIGLVTYHLNVVIISNIQVTNRCFLCFHHKWIVYSDVQNVLKSNIFTFLQHIPNLCTGGSTAYTTLYCLSISISSFILLHRIRPRYLYRLTIRI